MTIDNDKFYTVFEEATDPIIIMDLEGNFLDLNKASYNLLGYRKDEMMSLHIYQVISKVFHRKFQEYLSGVKTDKREVFESEQVTKNGEKIPVEMSCKFVKIGGKETVLAVIRNITEWKNTKFKLEKENAALEMRIDTRSAELEKNYTKLKNSKNSAEEASEAKSSFIANMSHELRTPLNSILGFSGILLRDMVGKLDKKQKEYIGYIEDSGNHLLSLINDILDLSKIEAGKMELNFLEFEINSLVDQTLSFFKDKCIENKLKLTQDIEENIPVIIADERKIKQVLLNVLGNAVKFTPSGGNIEITVKYIDKTEREILINKNLNNVLETILFNYDNWLQFSIRDSGPGIKNENMRKLFQPFVQLDSGLEKKFEGTGLGLVLCRKIIQMHDGYIWAESLPESGGLFHFIIPYGKAKSKEISTVCISRESFIERVDKMIPVFQQKNVKFIILKILIHNFNKDLDLEPLAKTICTGIRDNDTACKDETNGCFYLSLAYEKSQDLNGMLERFKQLFQHLNLKCSTLSVKWPEDGNDAMELMKKVDEQL